MKTFKQTKLRLAIQAGITVVALTMLAQPVMAAGQGGQGGQAGTTLTVTPSANGYWNQQIEYDWTIQKALDEASSGGITLGSGEFASKKVTYTVDVTKTQKGEPVNVYGADGKVCVTNGGNVATEDLSIVGNLLASDSGPYYLVADATVIVDVSSAPFINPNDTKCYTFNIPFTPSASASYKVETAVTITNHSGSLGTPKGPAPDASFTLPILPVLTKIDDSTVVVDTMSGLPDGFTVTLPTGFTGQWTLPDGGNWTYEVTIARTSACDLTATLTNKIVLTENDTQVKRESTASLSVETPSCDVPPPPVAETWCSPGYWRNHTDSWTVPTTTTYSSVLDGAPKVTNTKPGNCKTLAADPTLLDVLKNNNCYGGETFNSVGDYLSTQHPGVNFLGTRWADSCPLN